MHRSFLPACLALSLVACGSTTEPTPANDGGPPPSTLDGGGASDAGGDAGEAPTDAGADASNDAIACAWGSDVCPAGTYCSAPGCGKGVCVPKGVTEEPGKAVVCGCDGVNYWNGSLAAAHGIAVRGEGACAADGIRCGGLTPPPNNTCPTTARCVAVHDNDQICMLSDLPGTCWTMPSDCTGSMGRARSCATGGAAEVACTSECELIKSDFRVVLSADCE